MSDVKISTTLMVRIAKLSDEDQIEKIMKLSMQSLGRGYYSNDQIYSSCKYICVPDKQIIEDGTYYVVEDQNGVMIGCGGWSFRKTLYAGPKAKSKEDDILDPKKDMARIRAMFVLPAISSKGIGSLILKTSEQAALAQGFTRGALGATQSGLMFYKAKGWGVIKEEIATLPDGIKIEITHMEKEL